MSPQAIVSPAANTTVARAAQLCRDLMSDRDLQVAGLFSILGLAASLALLTHAGLQAATWLLLAG